MSVATATMSGKTALLALSVGLLATMAVLFAIAPWDLDVALALRGGRESLFGEFIQNWGRKPASGLVVLAAYALLTPAYRMAHPIVARCSAALCVHMLLQPALLTNVIKLLTGRNRPIHLGPNGEGFMPFLPLSPRFGDLSFPSGHVAIAMIIAPCVIILWQHGRRLSASTVLLACLCWAGLVAVGRMVYEAHFLTDVLFSILAGTALAPCSVYLGDRAWQWLNRRNKTAHVAC